MELPPAIQVRLPSGTTGKALRLQTLGGITCGVTCGLVKGVEALRCALVGSHMRCSMNARRLARALDARHALLERLVRHRRRHLRGSMHAPYCLCCQRALLC